MGNQLCPVTPTTETGDELLQPLYPDIPRSTNNLVVQINQLTTVIRQKLEATQFRLDVPISLRKLINVADVQSQTPEENAAEYQYVENSRRNDFLATDNRRTDNLIYYIIVEIMGKSDMSLQPDCWVELCSVIDDAVNSTCGTTKLLKLCFLSHLCRNLKAVPQIEVDFIAATSIEAVTVANLPLDDIATFCAAARSNEYIQDMIPKNFVQPTIVPFKIGSGLCEFEYRGFVLDGNFVAVNASYLLLYARDNACLTMYVHNICFHQMMHAANRQVNNSFQIHTPEHPGLIGTSAFVAHSRGALLPLEAGYIGEKAIWGMIPNWRKSKNCSLAEAFADSLLAQCRNGIPLQLNQRQMQQLKYLVSEDRMVFGGGGLIAAKVISFM